jgi:hypothetical protein
MSTALSPRSREVVGHTIELSSIAFQERQIRRVVYRKRRDQGEFIYISVVWAE